MTAVKERPQEQVAEPASAAPTVVQALAAVMAEVRQVRKDGRVQPREGEKGPRYSFRGIDAVMNAVGPALRNHGVIVVPMHVDTSYGTATSKGGGQMREVTVMVTYRFYGPAGDYIDIMAPGESLDTGDKGTPKAMSVAFRTALLQALCLPTDEKDPDEDVYERGSHAPAQSNGSGSNAEAQRIAERQEAKAEALKLGAQLGWKGGQLEADFRRRYGKPSDNATAREFIKYAGVLEDIVNAQQQENQAAELAKIEGAK